MSNTAWVMIGLVFIVLAVAIGIYLYQKSKNDAAEINAQKLAAIQAGVAGAASQGYQASGFASFFQNILGTTLNSKTTQTLIPLAASAYLQGK
jgi:uncharacterized protein YpmB